MAIFRKRIIRSSGVTVAIEADTWDEADNIFHDWLNDYRNSENLNEILDERERDKEEVITCIDNMDKYNRSSFTDDFLITKPKEEPKYDLYFTFKGSPGKAKVFMDCTMDMVLEKLHDYNCAYFLTRKDVYDADAHGNIRANVNKIHFECEGR